jgi:hypothetical protein
MLFLINLFGGIVGKGPLASQAESGEVGYERL